MKSDLDPGVLVVSWPTIPLLYQASKKGKALNSACTKLTVIGRLSQCKATNKRV